MWILILAFTMSSSGVSIHSVPGFSTPKECEVAGMSAITNLYSYGYMKYKYVCVYQSKATSK